MSKTSIIKYFRIGGTLTDPTSVKLSDRTATYGVKRHDNDAVVVADDTAMTKESTGIYTHEFTDPAADLTYDYVVEVVYDGTTLYWEESIEGTVSTGVGKARSLLRTHVLNICAKAGAAYMRDGSTTYAVATNYHLDAALDIIGGMYAWKKLTRVDETLTMQPGLKGYTIPSNIRAVGNVRWVDDNDGEGGYLEAVDNDTFDDENPYPQGDTLGRPIVRTERYGKIEVAPIPGVAQCSLVTGTDSNLYYCILNHTSAAATCPTTGGSYATYWTQYTAANYDVDETANVATWAADTDYFCEKLYVSGLGWPTQFAGDSSVSGMARDLDWALIYEAAALLYEAIDEDERAQLWHAKARAVADRCWETQCGLSEV